MPPILALSIWFFLLLLLLRRDPAADRRVSIALWVPLTWLAILASRLPSQWLGLTDVSAAAAYQDGNFFDRGVYIILIAAAIHILWARSIGVDDAIRRNAVFVLLLAFAFISAIWSDFPFVSFKRWVRDFGTYLMVLVVLTDPRPLDALQTLIRRLCYLLIPLSVILVKYFPDIGRGYSDWTGAAYYLGVTTSKNMLGALCLLSGLFFIWDTANRWTRRHERSTRRIVLINAAFIGMTLWLLRLSNSATSLLSLVIGAFIILAAHSKVARAHPHRLTRLVPAAAAVYLVLELGFGLSDAIIRALGREVTLTGRTDLWAYLLGMNINPILGAGYETFWLGERLRQLWDRFLFRPNQAHNGYLEIYLNLGVIGLCLFGAVLVATYRTISNRLTASHPTGSLSVALWAILIVYNVTEAAFLNGVLWFVFLLGAMNVPRSATERRVARAPQSTAHIRNVPVNDAVRTGAR